MKAEIIYLNISLNEKDEVIYNTKYRVRGRWLDSVDDSYEVTNAKTDKELMAIALENKKIKEAQNFKNYKKQLLENLVVTTSLSNTFDANEPSRNNMLSAITASEVLGLTSSSWKLADNSIAIIDISELKEALALSIKRAGDIILAETIEDLDE